MGITQRYEYYSQSCYSSDDRSGREGIIHYAKGGVTADSPGASREENHKIGMEWCRKAKKQGADIAHCFLKCGGSGYQISEDVENHRRQEAVSADGEFVMSFGRLAKELDMAIAGNLFGASRAASQKHDGAI